MRKRASWLCSLLVLVSPLALGKDKPFPALIVNARYVLVTTYAGDDATSPRTMPDDRKAVGDVETALKRWGRYVVVYNRRDAEIILRVRKGSVAEALVGPHIHVGTDKPSPTVGPAATGDVNTTTEDMLEIFDATLGTDSPPLWRAFRTGGLNPPDMSLVRKLRSEVEASVTKP